MRSTRSAAAPARAPAVVCFALVAGFTFAVASGCDRPSGQTARAPSTPATDAINAGAAPGVRMDAQAVSRLGVRTEILAAAQYREQIDAIAVGVDPAPLFQLSGDLAVAEAARLQSAKSLERARALFADNGNGSRQNLEAAQAQATQDAARAEVLERRFATEWGGPLARAETRNELIDELARADAAIVRIDLDPTAVVASPAQMQVQIRSIAAPSSAAAGIAAPSSAAAGIEAQPWPAPTANPMRPGPSFFAVVRDTTLARPGSRLRALVTPGAQAMSGALLPASALIYAQGSAWCYLASSEQGEFRRVPIDVSRPLQDGYFVSGEPRVGSAVVVSGAGLLLAQEVGSQTQDSDAGD